MQNYHARSNVTVSENQVRPIGNVVYISLLENTYRKYSYANIFIIIHNFNYSDYINLSEGM